MGCCLISMTMNDLLPSPICLRESNLRGLANNTKYDDTISFVVYGDKPSVAVTSHIVCAVCHPTYFLLF